MKKESAAQAAEAKAKAAAEKSEAERLKKYGVAARLSALLTSVQAKAAKLEKQEATEAEAAQHIKVTAPNHE